MNFGIGHIVFLAILGYLFTFKNIIFKDFYFRKSYDGFRFIIYTASFGIFIYATSSILNGLNDYYIHCYVLKIDENSLAKYFPGDIYLINNISVSLTISIVAPMLINSLYWKFIKNPNTIFLGKIIKELPFGNVIWRAIIDEIPIIITLDSRKVYIAFVLINDIIQNYDKSEIQKSISARNFTVIPIENGYRREDSLVLSDDLISYDRKDAYTYLSISLETVVSISLIKKEEKES